MWNMTHNLHVLYMCTYNTYMCPILYPVFIGICFHYQFFDLNLCFCCCKYLSSTCYVPILHIMYISIVFVS